MKELSIEEKAKAYDIALDKIKMLLGTGSSCSREELEYVFPELKEGEDERIRKTLVAFFTDWHKTRSHCWGISVPKILAWLKKKGEQKSADLPNGEDYGIDGLYAAVDILQKTLGKVDGYQTDDGILEHECAISAVKKLYEQKPAEWSEVDKMQLDAAIHLVSSTGHIETTNWLKSIKNRVLQQNFTVTDEELAKVKKDAYNDALDKIEYHSGEPTFDDGWSAAIWYLKKKNARPQSTWKPSDEQLDSLYDVLNPCDGFNREVLESLYVQLKKLREE